MYLEKKDADYHLNETGLMVSKQSEKELMNNLTGIRKRASYPYR